VSLVLCGLTLLLASVVSSGARRRLLGLHWAFGTAIVVGVAAPWFVYMVRRFGDDFLTGYVLDENIRLYATNRFRSTTSVWFYFRILAAGVLPWTGVLVGRFVDYVRGVLRREEPDVLESLLWAWTIAVVGFFSLSRFRLDHYIFPAAPAICLLCARSWVELTERPHDPALRGSRIGLHLVGPLFVAVGVGAGVFVIGRLELPAGAIVSPIAMAIAGSIATATLNVRGGRPTSTPPIFIPIATVITYGAILVYVVPVLEQRKVMPDMGRWVATHVSSDDRVASYAMNRWSTAFRFYLGRHVEPLNSPEQARRFFSSHEIVFCIMPKRAYDEFVAQGVPLRVAYAREGFWATSGRVLWRRRIPPAEFVVVSNDSL
jgi:4-amino-4-deoxy-L-arabinose transferase-like glycosyltransferase